MAIDQYMQAMGNHNDAMSRLKACGFVKPLPNTPGPQKARGLPPRGVIGCKIFFEDDALLIEGRHQHHKTYGLPSSFGAKAKRSTLMFGGHGRLKPSIVT